MTEPPLYGWLVVVSGYDAQVFVAASAPKAKYKAYRAFCEAFGRRTFRAFLARGVCVSPASEIEIEQSGRAALVWPC